ncbi:hypothetical protein SSS_03295 [Sarcoptes scabiei]|uniref:Uncharacterized protein n=1 Tax=Sarcoptes scabiei TaxID=52283 RepID=A0A834RE63_SARSC|nr:hypothetical protein SSS_03295 [Sarcoptes scabiei]UXI15378.1 hypothetical protein NH340_JMT01321 [Sarcoptes scabiei]
MDVSMDDTNQTQPPVRINGSLMANYLHSKAVIIGFVTRADADGKRATIKTTDDEFIQIVFVQPLNFSLQPNQLIEAYGTVTGSHQFQCLKFSHFQPEVSANFNCKNYNKFIQYYLTHLDRLNIRESNDEEQQPILKVINNDFEIDWNNASKKEGGVNALDDTMKEYDSWN